MDLARVFPNCAGLSSINVDSENSVYHSEGNCLIETTSKTLIFGCKNSVIPSDGSVTSIGGHAFYDCTGLTSITIPNSITSIWGVAFYGCTKLTSIKYQGTKAQWQAIDKAPYWNYSTGDYIIYCNDGEIKKHN